MLIETEELWLSLIRRVVFPVLDVVGIPVSFMGWYQFLEQQPGRRPDGGSCSFIAGEDLD